MNIKNAEITREYGPLEGAPIIHGIEYDGNHLWLATGERLQALNPTTGRGPRRPCCTRLLCCRVAAESDLTVY